MKWPSRKVKDRARATLGLPRQGEPRHSDGHRTHTEQTVGGVRMFTNAGMVQRDPDLGGQPVNSANRAKLHAEAARRESFHPGKETTVTNGQRATVKLVPPQAPADLLADFLLDVAQKQEMQAAKVSARLGVRLTLMDRLKAERSLVHHYAVAKYAHDQHEAGTPITEALPGITLAMAIAARSHNRAPNYPTIAEHVYRILEDHL